jgi:signal transduction histidine kinase
MRIPLYGASSILIAITSLGISVFVFTKGSRNRRNRIWILLTLAIALYGFGAYMVSISSGPQEAHLWWQVAYMGIIFIPALFMHFVCKLIDIKRPVLLRILYSITFFLWVLNIASRDIFLGNVTLFFADSQFFKPGYWVYPPSPWLIFFIIFVFFGTAILSHIELIRGFRKATPLKRSQIKYFLMGTLPGFIGGGTAFLPCFNIGFYPVFNIAVILYPLITAYTIVKYRLMEIPIAITRTGIFVAVYTLALGVPFLIAAQLKNWLIDRFGFNWWVLPLGAMAILATLGTFIYIYLQRKADERLFRVQRSYHEVLRKTAGEMTRIRNLGKLLHLIVNTIAETVRISHVAIYLFDKEQKAFNLKESCNLQKGGVGRVEEKNPVVTWLKDRREPLVYGEVQRKFEETSHFVYKELMDQMQRLKATVIVPSFLEHSLLNLLILGDKVSKAIYTAEDLRIFAILAGQIALAIENALLYENIEAQVHRRTEELIDVQKQLVQAEKLATVGTLAGGVAHEINNPLAAILTNVQMLLSEDEMDLDEARESLALIEEATKRCRTIVKKLMTYAKKPLETATLGKVDLFDVIDRSVNFLIYQLTQEDIKVLIEAQAGTCFVSGNQNELEQVVTNLVLNSRDAIKRVKKSGDIGISLKKNAEFVEISVRDEGVGIPEEVMSKIFDPFFTTKDVGKGLGLGLSICQSIVQKHGGTVSVESASGRGAVFTVKLPAA